MKYSTMPRCCPFFVSPRREEGVYPSRGGGITDEQRRRSGKTTQPGGRRRFGPAGGIACSLSRYCGTDMLVARVLPSRPKRSRATWLSTSSGS